MGMGAGHYARGFAQETVGRYPGWSLALIIVLVLVILGMTFGFIGVTAKSRMTVLPDSNFRTGGNNPLWQYGAQDSGWGGSMHSTQDVQAGERRAYGASGTGYHSLGETSSCMPYDTSCAMPGAYASAEAQALQQAGALDAQEIAGTNMSYAVPPSPDMMGYSMAMKGTAKGMSDDNLRQYMHGGGMM